MTSFSLRSNSVVTKIWYPSYFSSSSNFFFLSIVKPNPLLLPLTAMFLDLISPFSTDSRTNLSSFSALQILDSLSFLFVCATDEFHTTTYFLRPLIIEVATSLCPIFTSPQNIEYTASSVPLIFTIEDTSDIEWTGYSLDGAENVTISGSTLLTDLANGAHTIAVHARDAAKKTGSASASFTVNTAQEDTA